MSNPIVEKLYEERANLWDQMKELNDREIKEERSLDASEKEAWDKMNDRMSEIDARTSELALDISLLVQVDFLRTFLFELSTLRKLEYLILI